MGVYLYLHRDDSGRIVEFEEGRRDVWNYFRSEIPDEQRVTASTPQPVDVSKYTTLDLGTYWGILLFMLCESYRNQVSPQSSSIEDLHLEDPLYWAIAGANVADYDTGWHYPLRYSTVAQVKQVADALTPVTFEDLRPYGDADAMCRAGIYRSGTYVNSSRMQETLRRMLTRLQVYYRDTTEHGQIVIHEWV